MRRIVPIIDAEGMHSTVRVSRKRQITIPKFAQEALGLKPGDRVYMEGSLTIRPGDWLRLTVRQGRMELRPLD